MNRFVASGKRDLKIGDHTIRADRVGVDGAVTARVEVPFQRHEGQLVAAVTPALAAQTRSSQAESPEALSRRGETLSLASKVQTAESVTVENLESDSSQIAPQAELESVKGRVIIRKGDTLWQISRTHYGKGTSFSVIYLANNDQITNPDRIYPGQVFRLPDGNEKKSGE